MESTAKIFAALAVAGLLVSACGNGGNTTNNVTTTTVGEELASLEKAYGEGLLTEKEYEAQRKKILDRKK
ncbi:hypothetical protein [Shimia sp. SDUM112013]|uniref:hypothetical protein n=1 Tax=Shimia sp. SDUM112013 TaxID=3136160 RepID=UPI0032EE2F77